ncbi:MAG TPA: hypothetical protein VNG53_02555 [Bacteroidia bacterium]|nr:hypothetical protein [Bacteroidia bacterium]
MENTTTTKKSDFTKDEKLLIYNAFNGKFNRFYPEKIDNIGMPTEEELRAVGNPDELISCVKESLKFENANFLKLEVDRDIMLDKLSKLEYQGVRQLRNEIYAFWNPREMLEILNECNLLIKNTHELNN